MAAFFWIAVVLIEGIAAASQWARPADRRLPITVE
jgi:hypothetical protein